MKEIQLSQGKVALVDDEDFDRIKDFHWYARKTGNTFYAAYKVKSKGKSTTFYMHRIILNAPSDIPVDHADGNGLNNQKSNIRLCSHSENMRNTKMFKNNTSGFKGVSWHKRSNKWRAVIKVNAKHKHLGLFQTDIAAANAYNDAAKKYYGDFARLNNI